jgi:hypothetical protein
MPVPQYLKDNVLTLVTASWENADGTAGAGFENAGTLTIPRGNQTIDNGCDQTGSTTGLESFDVYPDFSGSLGPGTALKFDVDGTAESAANVVSRFRYWASSGNCRYDSANGCHFLQVGTFRGGGGAMNCVGGTFKHLHMEKGSTFFTDAASCTSGGTFSIYGGKLTLDVHASNTFNIIDVFDGANEHTLRRGGTTLSAYGGTTVVDIKNSTVTNLNVKGGTISLRSHNATGPTLVAEAGVIDFTQLRGNITFSAPVLGPVRLVGYNRNRITFSSPVFRGGGPIGMN